MTVTVAKQYGRGHGEFRPRQIAFAMNLGLTRFGAQNDPSRTLRMAMFETRGAVWFDS